MSKFDQETVTAALTLLIEKIAVLENLQVRDLIAPGRYDEYKTTLDAAYGALVTVENALDSLGMKLEYHHWRISSAFEEVKPLLSQTRMLADAALETFEQDIERKNHICYNLSPMTAYQRPFTTTTQAASQAKAKRRKNLAVWWRRAGYVIHGYSKSSKGNTELPF